MREIERERERVREKERVRERERGRESEIHITKEDKHTDTKEDEIREK